MMKTRLASLHGRSECYRRTLQSNEAPTIDTQSRPVALAEPLSGSRSLTFGFSLMLLAFFLFVIMDTSAKWLVLAGLPALQVAFTRFFVHLIWVLIIYVPREGGSLFLSKVRGVQLLRGCLLTGATFLNFTALKYLPLPVTISIFFAGPMLVCLLSIPILGEKVGPRRFTAVITGFAGVLVILQPWSETFDWRVIYSLGAMSCASLYFVLSRLIRGADGNGTTQLHAAIPGTLILAPLAISQWTWPDSTLAWCLLILLGSFGLFGHTLVTKAHEFAEASVLAPTVYSQIIFVTLLSYFVFNTPPSLSTLTGAVIIIVSGLYLWWRERALARV